MRVSDIAFASGRGWKIRGHDGASRTFDLVIVAAGPWSGEIAAKLGYDVPMFWARGYHQHTETGQGAALGRPVHVVDEGFVMSTQSLGTRVTAGEELDHRHPPPASG